MGPPTDACLCLSRIQHSTHSQATNEREGASERADLRRFKAIPLAGGDDGQQQAPGSRVMGNTGTYDRYRENRNRTTLHCILYTVLFASIPSQIKLQSMTSLQCYITGQCSKVQLIITANHSPFRFSSSEYPWNANKRKMEEEQ